MRRRMRLCLWTQWKRVRTRCANLRTLGMNHTDALKYANTRKGYWRIAGSMILTTFFTPAACVAYRLRRLPAHRRFRSKGFR